MKTTRSATSRAKPISWVTQSIVMPCRASSSMTVSTSLTISGSRADVGSSNSMTFGSIARARAMATRCCWPPDSWAGYFSAWSATPTRSSSSMARSRAASFDRPRTRTGASVTLSMTRMWLNRLNCWKTIPTSARSRVRSRPSSGRSRPATRISPESTVSSRLTVRHSVDFPAPDGPRTTTTSPVRTSRDTSSRARWSPKLLVTRRRDTMTDGSGVAAPGDALSVMAGTVIQPGRTAGPNVKKS